MKVLIIGLGSIGQKHLRALRELQRDVEVFALRSGKSNEVEGVTNVYGWKDLPVGLDFAMVCNPTSKHLDTIGNLVELNIPLFVEKPPFMTLQGVDGLMNEIKARGIRTYTAFNLRFLPIVKWLKENLQGRKVLEVQAYCGSYLPDWRPGRDYREVYSSKADLGGGVHLDLIHELDYLLWIFGEPNLVQSDKGKISDLEIDSFDYANYLLSYEAMKISITLNYYRRDAKRQLQLVMEDDTWVADLLTGQVTDSRGNVLFEDKRPILDTYTEQLRYFIEGLSSDKEYMNNLTESVRTLKHALS